MYGTVLRSEQAKSATGRTRLLRGQGVGLLLQQALQCSFNQSGGGRLGDLLHGVEIEGDGVIARAAGDDFAPLGGKVVQFVQFGVGDVRAWHGMSYLGVTLKYRESLLLFSIFTSRTQDKAVHGLSPHPIEDFLLLGCHIWLQTVGSTREGL
jgi:hypothetical protein